jgi:putative effector of murein hydrolase
MHDGAVTAFVIAVTLVTYVVSREIFLRTRVTLLNPVFVSTIVIILVLFAFGIRGDQYQPGRELMTLLLGPATVALAVPLYRHRRRLVTYWASIALGIVCGSVATIATVILFARWASLDRMLVLAVAPKSVTTPVAIDIARILGTNMSITAVLVEGLRQHDASWFQEPMGIALDHRPSIAAPEPIAHVVPGDGAGEAHDQHREQV